jgi:hypothetical protein
MQAQPMLEPSPQAIPTPDGPSLRYLRPAGRFALQFIEMCAAMCVGGIALDLVFFQGLAVLGSPNFFQENRELSILVLGINWAIAMGVWMAVRGNPWRHNIEMSSTAVVTAVLLIAAYWWFGFAPASKVPGWFGQALFQCGPSCALMGAYMLFRYKHYTGSAQHHAHQMA